MGETKQHATEPPWDLGEKKGIDPDLDAVVEFSQWSQDRKQYAEDGNQGESKG